MVLHNKPVYVAQYRASHLGLGRRVGVRGFTLIELIMVIVLVGVMSVFVAPKFNASDFYARGFHDETLALLRYAQKTAVAQRRTVCVAYTASGASLSIASAASVTTCNTNLVGPRGENQATVTAKSGVTYNPTPTTGFYFNGLGQPSAAQTVQVSGASGTITVEAVTGYVHD